MRHKVLKISFLVTEKSLLIHLIFLNLETINALPIQKIPTAMFDYDDFECLTLKQKCHYLAKSADLMTTKVEEHFIVYLYDMEGCFFEVLRDAGTGQLINVEELQDTTRLKAIFKDLNLSDSEEEKGLSVAS